MTSWQDDLLSFTECAECEHEVFGRIESAARALGFEYCAYGLRLPVSLSNPKTIILSNYPQAWRERYASADYLQIDPTVQHGRNSQSPLVWSDSVFSPAPQLWEEAKSFGLRVGWAQSRLDALGVRGMLSLSRSCEPLTTKELECNEPKMRWLAIVAHLSLARLFRAKQPETTSLGLTSREIEILKWTADGKSAQDIAAILQISKNTVEFHVKNAVAKLQTTNKTAAAVRAAMLGLLN